MKALVMVLVATAFAGCAQAEPRGYVIDGNTKSITPADLREILTVAQNELHTKSSIPPAPPIYRIHVRSATRVEVWFGDPTRGKWLNYILVGRFPGYKGWMDAGGGEQLRAYPRPNQALQPTTDRRESFQMTSANLHFVATLGAVGGG